jgi:hypothetical protein
MEPSELHPHFVVVHVLIFIFNVSFLHPMCNVFFFWCVVYVANKVIPSILCTFVAWTCLCFVVDGNHVIPLRICLEEGYFHHDFITTVKVCQGQLHGLFWNTTFSFRGNELCSFFGLLKSYHQQIHTKWVTNYNMNCIEHLAFVLNDKYTCAHWVQVICP